MLKPGKLFLSRNSICSISADLCTTVAMQQPQLRFFFQTLFWANSKKSRFLLLVFLCWRNVVMLPSMLLQGRKKKKKASHPLQRIQQIKWEGGQLRKEKEKNCCILPNNFLVCFSCVSWGSDFFDFMFSIQASRRYDSFILGCQIGKYPFHLFQSKMRMHSKCNSPQRVKWLT